VHLSETTAVRYSDLLKSDGVSKQEVDNANGDLAAKRAIVQSAEANVRRLEELKSFQRIDAPLAASLPAAIPTLACSSTRQWRLSQQLFFLAQTDPMRVYVNVPEAYASSIRPGIGAYLELTQFPARDLRASRAHRGGIDLSTRTLLTEVDVPNNRTIVARRLRPGSSSGQSQGQRLQVPVNALLFRSEGLRAVVIACESPRASAISHHRPRLRHQPRSA